MTRRTAGGDVPGWCKQCNEPIDPHERPGGQPRIFCSDRCRQRFHRQKALREDLRREVLLDDRQITLLLQLFTVSKRDAKASRIPSRDGAR